MSESAAVEPAQAPTETTPEEVTDWKAEARKWEQRAKKNASASEKLEQLEEAAAEREAAAEKRVAEAEARAARREIALEHKLSREDATLLDSVADEDAMRALAARLAKQAEDSKPKGRNYVPNEGTGQSTTPLDEQRAFVRRLTGRE